MPPPFSRPRDAYAVLGLAPDADDVVIRAAYKALLRKHHPDVSGDGTGAERTAAITAAFHQIGTPAARADYDRARLDRPPMPQGGAIPPRAAPRLPPRRWVGPVVVTLLLGLLAGSGWLMFGSGGEELAPPRTDAAVITPSAHDTAPPPDPALVRRAIGRAAALIRGHDLAGARQISLECPIGLHETGWRAADYCATFDLAAAAADRASPAGRAAPDPFLATAADVVAGRYALMGVDQSIEGRIDMLRAVVAAELPGALR